MLLKKRGTGQNRIQFYSYLAMRQRKAKDKLYSSDLYIGYLREIWFAALFYFKYRALFFK